MSVRKIKFWTRIREGRPTTATGKYTSKRKANAASKRGEHLVLMEGFYWRDDGLVMGKDGRWRKP